MKSIKEKSEEYAYTNWESDEYHDGDEFDPIGHTQKAFIAGAKWAEVKIQAQSMAVAHGCPKETVIYGKDQTMNSSNKFSNICQTTKR